MMLKKVEFKFSRLRRHLEEAEKWKKNSKFESQKEQLFLLKSHNFSET